MSPAILRMLAGCAPAQSALPPSAQTGVAICANRVCDFEATAEILVGATWMPACFRHEREYADRYGPGDIRPLS